MGAQRAGTGFPGDLVLDAGALIAFERGNEHLKGILRASLVLKSRIIVPASALAQAWREGPRAALLARLLDSGELDLLEERRAKEVGLRLGERSESDITDAHVVCCAIESRAAIATSDPDDLQALARPGERLTLITV